jgi:hypothetical protein
MSYCGKSARASLSLNYDCMRKGIGVGKNIKLPRGYRPESRDPRKNFYCGESSRAPSGKQKGNPFECFRKRRQ